MVVETVVVRIRRMSGNSGWSRNAESVVALRRL